MKEKKGTRDYTWMLIVMLIIILIIVWTSFFFWNLETDLEHRAQIGDSFGSLNALFSALALAGVIVTIILQGRELSETRKEFQIQNKTLSNQRFENTFFNLLNLHHQIVEGIDYEETVQLENKKVWRIAGAQDDSNLVLKTYKGRDVFRLSFEELNDKMSSKLPKGSDRKNPKPNSVLDDINSSHKIYDEIYSNIYDRWNTDFGHYFRNLYRIVKFVDETTFLTKLDFEVKKNEEELLFLNFKIRYQYVSMLRSQLSDYELDWLFYNCLSSLGKTKFKPLVEKYGLLKNLNKKIFNENLLNQYSSSAFINPLSE
ncbi:MAG: putative phage abortive infection protein [Nonlabens sp.]